MGIKEFIFNEESKKNGKIFMKMLKWLDSSGRKKINNPEKLLKASGIRAGQAVLEIGCGSAFFTIPASGMLGKEGRLYSIDIHPLAVEETQRKVKDMKLQNVIVKKEDAMKSSFADAMFDLVLLYGVVPAPVISMKDISKEIYRVLKPGGICAIWTAVPFWTPRTALKYASFQVLKKCDGVFLLQK